MSLSDIRYMQGITIAGDIAPEITYDDEPHYFLPLAYSRPETRIRTKPWHPLVKRTIDEFSHVTFLPHYNWQPNVLPDLNKSRTAWDSSSASVEGLKNKQPLGGILHCIPASSTARGMAKNQNSRPHKLSTEYNGRHLPTWLSVDLSHLRMLEKHCDGNFSAKYLASNDLSGRLDGLGRNRELSELLCQMRNECEPGHAILPYSDLNIVREVLEELLDSMDFYIGRAAFYLQRVTVDQQDNATMRQWDCSIWRLRNFSKESQPVNARNLSNAHMLIDKWTQQKHSFHSGMERRYWIDNLLRLCCVPKNGRSEFDATLLAYAHSLSFPNLSNKLPSLLRAHRPINTDLLATSHPPIMADTSVIKCSLCVPYRPASSDILVDVHQSTNTYPTDNSHTAENAQSPIKEHASVRVHSAKDTPPIESSNLVKNAKLAHSAQSPFIVRTADASPPANSQPTVHEQRRIDTQLPFDQRTPFDGRHILALIENFFTNPVNSGQSSSDPPLNKLFDKYRDDAENNPDTIFTEGALNYFKDVDISVENIGVLLVSEQLSCPTLGEITRQGFISGWSGLGATTTIVQRSHLSTMITGLRRADSHAPGGRYRRVYKHTFNIARPAGSKSVPLEIAAEYWKILFSKQGMAWVSGSGTPWLDWWLAFLEEKWKKAINKDMWDQTLLFAVKSIEDDTLSWWSEDSAWPGIIDEFAAWSKTKRADADATDIA